MVWSKIVHFVGVYFPILILYFLATLHSTECAENDPEEAYPPDWSRDLPDKRLSEFLGGPGKRLSEFLGGPGKRFPVHPSHQDIKRLSEFLGGPGKRRSDHPLLLHPGASSKRLSEFLGGPGKRSADYYDFLGNSERR